jgi:hypothetical protein
MEEIPVSLFSDKFSFFKFANMPNSAGMGPGIYKTQSKHTTNTVTLLNTTQGGRGTEYRLAGYRVNKVGVI